MCASQSECVGWTRARRMSTDPDMRASSIGSRTSVSCDVLLVGGGLANSLIALELKSRRPDLRVVMLERSLQRDATHTWCIFKSDLSEATWALLSPIFDNIWPSYEVAFPAHARKLATSYARLTGERLGAKIEMLLGPDLFRGASASSITAEGAECEDGRVFRAPLVIDGRGFAGSAALRLAYQKFVGLEVDLDEPHDVAAPMVMDATVTQMDGFRFIYVLPLGASRLLIEDTRYSDGPELDPSAYEFMVRRFAKDHGWSIARIARTETGVLPVVLDGDISQLWRGTSAGVPTVGVAGAFFHPTTGYSLPDAARVAAAVAECPSLTSARVRVLVEDMSRRQWARGRFYRALNRMMFEAAGPLERYRVLERFYRLPRDVIERFYAGRLTLGDQIRIVSGRPPVPVAPALRAVFSRRDKFQYA